MIVKASGRSALIFATGLFVCFAGPSPVSGSQQRQRGRHLEIGQHDVAANPQAERASLETLRAQVRQGRHRNPPTAKKAAEKDVADASGDMRPRFPPSVANANAQLTSADAPRQRQAMTAKASMILLAAADKPAGQRRSRLRRGVVSSDQLNDVDRALQKTPATQTVAMAAAKPRLRTPVMASSNESFHLGSDLADRKDLHRLRRIADDGLRRPHVHGVR